jgi:hypothetical protein
MRLTVARIISAGALTLFAGPVAAGPAEDFCQAMQDQFAACMEAAAESDSCYKAGNSMIDTYFETSKKANPAQQKEMKKAINLWADMVQTLNQGDRSPRTKAIATLCERIQQAK